MNRTGSGGALGHDPLARVLGDHDKRALAAQTARPGLRDRLRT